MGVAEGWQIDSVDSRRTRRDAVQDTSAGEANIVARSHQLGLVFHGEQLLSLFGFHLSLDLLGVEPNGLLGFLLAQD
jgi:hypothetical protein